MADDIDIEEHDILDNPRIQDILHIKEEPIDIDHHYEEPVPANDEYNQYNYYHKNDPGQSEEQIPQYDQHTSDNPPDYDQEPPENPSDYDQNPPDNPSDYDPERLDEFRPDSEFNDPDEFDDTNMNLNESLEDIHYVSDLSNDIYHHNNKIILGTKPCKRPMRDVKSAYVSLEDWGVRLRSSDCYCKECQILFATQNALDAHNMLAHSFLVALDSPESPESDTTAKENSETAKYCDHCKKYFPSDHALIQHLYDLITANKQTTVAQAASKNDSNVPQQMVYSCLVCNCAYVDIKWASLHSVKMHKKPDHFEHIPFTGACKLCKYTSPRLKLFNCHVKDVHLAKMKKAEKEMSEKGVVESEVKTQPENGESQLDTVELQPESAGSTSVGTGPSSVTKKIRNFKCIKCKTFFTSKMSIQCHQNRFHKGENIIQKCVPKNVVSEMEKQTKQPVNVSQELCVVNIQPSPEVKFADNLVPKNSIFKCNKCKIHFVTCWSAILHTCVEMSMYQCDICCKKFPLKDTNIHLNQHKYNDAFNTYYICENMNTKLLFWCQNCAVYFELRKIQHHIKNCNGNSSSVRCKLCEVDVNDVLTHMNNHKIHPTKSDFIFIDDLLPSEDIPPEKNLKRKLPVETGPAPIKAKKLGLNEFLYCPKCQTCIKLSSRIYHLTGECKKIKSKTNCEYCGLVFFKGSGANYHEEYHRRTKSELVDFTFINILDNKRTVPLIPEFPKCEKCNVHDFASHQCGPYKSCKTCSKNFSDAAYKLHFLHHKYLRLDTEVSELIKRYETIAMIWNIVYLCKACNVATDSYDDVVQHCQNHFNNMHEVVTRNCDVCFLKLEETCFKRHKELHSPSVTKASFKTVVYDFNNLKCANKVWLDLFDSLSEAEKHQIVTRTIYVTRFVKMKLILNGPPELTIYKCETCKLYVDPNSVYNHTTQCVSSQEKYKKTFMCETCSIPFSSATARKEHEKLHSTPNITANSFRIVAFNEKSDRAFNANLQFNAAAFEPKTPVTADVHPTSKTSKTGLKNVIFYQCRQCKCCSLNAESLVRHKCVTKNELAKCEICQWHIPLTNSKEHLEWHKLNPHITKAHLKMVAIDNTNLKRKYESDAENSKRPTHKLHQCKKCKLCFVYWVKHLTCNKKRRQCYKCGYWFSHSNYETHKLWHMQNVKATKDDIKVVTLAQEGSAKLRAEKRMLLTNLKFNQQKVITRAVVDPLKIYQCQKCKLSSYIVGFVKKHTVCADKGLHHCSVCKLKFKNIGMKFHRNWHKDNPKASRKQIKIHPFKDMKMLKVKDENSSNILTNDNGYKCKKCGAESKKSIFVNKHKCSVSPPASCEKKPKSQCVYYQCVDCEACVPFKRHYCVPAHRIRICPRCKLKFSYNDILAHLQKHAKYKDMTRSKITVIPFKKSVDGTKANVIKPDMKKSDLNKPVAKASTVFRCSCGLHFISQKTIERHFNVCSPDHDIPSENCSKCGLLFPTNHLVSHLCNHHSYGKGNIEVKTIPTVTYYRCGSCECLFVDKARLLNHNIRCDVTKVRRVHCDECDLDFHNAEIRMHKESHSVSSDLTKPCRILTINNRDSKNKKRTIEDSGSERRKLETARLDVADESDNSQCENYDNNLYKCKDCNTHFLKWDTCARHKKRGQCREEMQCCPYCKYNFTSYSLKKHLEVHHNVMKLTPDDFIINVCDPVSGKIISKSVPKPKSPETIDDSENEDTSDSKVDLFKCHICNTHYLKAISLKNHYVGGLHNVVKTLDCSKCGLTFAAKALDSHFILHHTEMKLKGSNNFNIVQRPEYERYEIKSDNTTKQAKVDSPIVAKNEKLNVTQDDIDELAETTITEEETEDRIYYNCVKCNVNFTNLRSLELHFNGKHIRNSVEMCKLCGLSFNTLIRHKEHHHLKPSGVFLIQDVSDESESVNKLFKCKCGVHFTKPQLLIIHMNKLPVDHSVEDQKTVVNCPDCGLLFAPRTLRMHQALHHGENFLDLKDLVIDTSIGKLRTIKYGSDDNMVPQSSSEEVAETNDLTVDPESNDDVSSTNTSLNNSTKLYKCGKCNVYFLTQATCYKHIVKHVPMDPKEYIECKLCSFQFRIVSLNTHIRRHHKTDFAFEKVLIEEYQPKAEDEKVPKIDLYYAKDKVQSRLISTTTDDSVVNSLSQSEIELADDPEASNDSKETIIISNTHEIDTAKENDCESKNESVNSFTDDPEVSNDSKDTVIITNSDADDKTDVDSINKNVMVKIPSFSFDLEASIDSKETSDDLDTKVDLDCIRDVKNEKTNESATKSNETVENVNKDTSNEGESSKTGFPCGFCNETFISRRAKDFHENLDHLDALKDCPVCKKNLHVSLLNAMHLQIKGDFFTCCVCGQNAHLNMLRHHTYIHQHLL